MRLTIDLKIPFKLAPLDSRFLLLDEMCEAAMCASETHCVRYSYSYIYMKCTLTCKILINYIENLPKVVERRPGASLKRTRREKNES